MVYEYRGIYGSFEIEGTKYKLKEKHKIKSVTKLNFGNILIKEKYCRLLEL